MFVRKTYFISILAGLISLVISGFGLAKASEAPTSVLSFAEKLNKEGIVNTADEIRLNQISVRIETHRQLTNDDIIFWALLLKKGPLISTPSKRYGFYAIVFGDMGGEKELTAWQRTKLFDAILPYVYDGAYSNLESPVELGAVIRSGAQILAIEVMTSTKDPRGLNVLNNLAKKSRLTTVRSAAEQQYIWLSSHVDSA